RGTASPASRPAGPRRRSSRDRTSGRPSAAGVPSSAHPSHPLSGLGLDFAAQMATERDYYVILGIERSATDADIKKAFRKLAQQWHPDVNTDAGAQERFKEINEAYQVLSDPQRRQTYDMFGKAGLGGDGGAGFDP